MKNRNAREAHVSALIVEMSSSDLDRARQLIMISIGFWLCIGVLTAIQTGSLA